MIECLNLMSPSASGAEVAVAVCLQAETRRERLFHNSLSSLTKLAVKAHL